MALITGRCHDSQKAETPDDDFPPSLGALSDWTRARGRVTLRVDFRCRNFLIVRVTRRARSSRAC